ncbi:MAG: adventurous gliding motility protein CglF [Deltaproteobacteria bacterium]|jgi:hypothetical protein|nr:adventurous gliding motility protein CglF [Deltaproteobacteria bacterium]
MRAWWLAAATAIALAAPALAQDKDVVTEGGVAYNRKTVINFEDDTIEGDLKTPDAVYLEARKKMRHRSLIRIRTDFRREVLGSIADL